jgi:hypothetical protein
VLLSIVEECAKQNIVIPWNEVGKRVAPFVTGEGVKQHIEKMYNARVVRQING